MASGGGARRSDDGARVARALGAVVGSAVGDALGAPFEFGPPGASSKRFPVAVLGGTGEMVGGGSFAWAPGEFTDDTQMGIVQAAAVLDAGGIDPALVFERLRRWAESATDVGVSTRGALASGLSWDRAATSYLRHHPDRGAGNGALMRATPVAVHLAAHGVDESMAAARRLAALTHGDPAAGWGAALLHAMIAVALDGDDPLDALPGLVDLLPPDQRERFAPLLTRRWSPADPHVANGSVWGCLAEAVWAVRSGGSFADIVGRAIDLGGDTDTVATVAGALAGAIGGVQSIPSRWLTYLHGWTPDDAAPDGPPRRWSAESLQAFTLQLVGLPVPPHAPPPEGTGPRRVAAGLHAADLTGALATASHWAVVSLCRVGDRFADRPVRRQVHLVDGDRAANPGLEMVLADVLDTIDAFHDEGREVVVHCHHGASRTGFVLRAWLIRRYRWDEPTATAHLRRLWPAVDCWNPTFTAALRRLAADLGVGE